MTGITNRYLLKPFLLLFVLFRFAHVSNAQHNEIRYPKIGDTIADYVFRDIRNHSGSELKISDFRGQWLMLDFWSRFCVTCIASFPKMNKLNADFKDRMKLVMVGLYSNALNKMRSGVSEEAYVKQIYEPKEKIYNLSYTNAFDSNAAAFFDIRSVPTILVVNPQGIIVSKTYSIDSTSLAKIINGEKTDLPYSYSENEKEVANPNYTARSPIFVKGLESNGGVDSLYEFRSMITKWNPKMPRGGMYGWSDSSRNGTAEIFYASLADMFRIAYTGRNYWWAYQYDSLNYKIYPNPVLLTTKKLQFEHNWNHTNTDDLYCYSLTLPPQMANIKTMRDFLLADLHRYFQLKSKLEERIVPCYELRVIDKRKVAALKTKNGEPQWIDETAKGVGFIAINQSLSQFPYIGAFKEAIRIKYARDAMHPPVIIDKTGINFNIDMAFEADGLDYYEMIAELRRHGLDLIEGKTKMQCIVIEDN